MDHLHLKGISTISIVMIVKIQSWLVLCDADFAANQDERRSISSYMFSLTSATVSWIFKLQYVVALSTKEAKYMQLFASM